MRTPVRIAGAGVAGLTAAIHLARAGREVVVFERAATVGSKHDRDLEGIENWSTREDALAEWARCGIALDFPFRAVGDGAVFGPGLRRRVDLHSPDRPFFYLVERGNGPDCLDVHLLRQARAAGARVVFNAAAPAEAVDIVATGSGRANVYAVGYVFRTRSPDFAAIVFDEALGPGAYTYLLISEGRGTLAIVTLRHDRGHRARLEHAVAALQKAHPFTMEEPRRVGGSGTFRLPRTAVREGRLYVGEAAGFQDYIAGFGLRYAVVSGHLAARSLLEGLDYDRLWRRAFGAHFRAGLVTRFVQERLGDRGHAVLLGYFGLRRRRVLPVLHSLYNFTWYKLPLYPLARRHLRGTVVS